MAARRKKPSAPLAGNADPRAPLDGPAFLAAAQRTVTALAADLLTRADASAGVTAALRARHAAEVAAQRTADGYDVFRRRFVGQVAAAWLLSLVFVRTLEDRGLLDRHRIAGPGAADSQRLFLQVAPHLTERDYLLTVFRELSRLPAARELFDRHHNPVWRLAPSAEGARALLDLFRAPSPEAPAFRFGQDDTRFLGDLYQDLDADVRERFALLQTPLFVEEFILDRTLDPAIDEFGLDATTLLDPTCGSGHFLLGGFERLFDRRLRETPGIDVRVAAHKALDAIHGIDLNPYAVAIARFRLTLAFLEKTGHPTLSAAPELPLHVVVADSLLHAEEATGQQHFADREDTLATEWKGEEFALDDEQEAKRVLRKGHAAVVGNPPYITVKDAALREVYRKLFPDSAAGKYALAAPFAEQFFRLARPGGFVGQITANSFMKREFGKKLVERVFAKLDLTLVVNTSGAYIPGHGTPTVLLFGRKQEPAGDTVRAVLAKRGEPSTPDDPAKGEVWSSIAAHWGDASFENDYISLASLTRSTLAKHPWSLGGGGASELKELLEERAATRLRDVVEDVGFASFTGLDDAFILPTAAALRQGVEPSCLRPIVTGEDVRDWTTTPAESAISPYDETTHEALQLDPSSGWHRFLWRYRATSERVVSFGGKTRKQAGEKWWTWYRWQSERYLAPFRLTFAFVATHNHFVLDRGGKAFSRSAPIVKLPASATEEDHLALLAYLNSSTACFWMKQVMHDKGSGTDTGKWQSERAKIAFEFAGQLLSQLPLPAPDPALAAPARTLLDLAGQREALVSPASLRRALAGRRSGQSMQDALAALVANDETLIARMIGLQEDIDWQVYRAFGLVQDEVVGESAPVALGARPFERALATRGETVGIDGQSMSRAPSVDALAERRLARLQAADEVAKIEHPEYKRRWRITPKDTGGRPITFFDRAQASLLLVLAEDVESAVRGFGNQPCSLRELQAAFANSLIVELAELSTPEAMLHAESVPYLAALRFTESGLEKHRAWQHTWALQRREDAGETIADIPVPPKYGQEDYRDAVFWRLRGKLDVPRERFIAYPGCESDEDRSPVYGWAGWNHLQQAQALAALYQKRKTEEAWQKDRLTPMLAGLDELVPWVKQWHNAPSDEFGGLKLGDYFDDFVGGECEALGIRREDLAAWRPAERTRGRAKKGARASVASGASGPAAVSTLVIPPGYDSMGLLDGDPIALADAAKLPYEDRVRVVAVELATGATVRPWVVSGDWDGHEGTGE